MKYSELKKMLKKDGWYLLRHGAEHDILVNDKKDGQVQLPRHGTHDVPK